MKIRQKLIISFFSLAVIVAIVGFVGLIASRQITKSFEGGEQHFRSIASSATELSSYVKSAEGSLMFYIMLHDKIDKVAFFNKYLLLQKEISLLDGNIKRQEARMIFNEIKFYTEELLPTGKALISEHDKDIRTSGNFETEKHTPLIRSFNDLTSSIRSKGLELAHFETNFLNRQEAITASTEISSLVKRAEGHLMLYLTIHDESDRDNFFRRYASLREHISILDIRIKDPETRKLLDRIKENSDKILPIGNALIYRHDHDMKSWGNFQTEKRSELLRMFSKTVSTVREDGIELAKFNIKLESQKKEGAINQAKNLQRIILGIIIASVFISLLLVYILSKAISKPVLKLKEAAARIGRGNLDTPINVTSSDEIGSLASTFRKMTEELQKTMVSKAYVDNIITSMMDSLVVVDLSGNIQSVNKALCSMLDYSEGELTGHPVQIIFGEDYPFEDEREYLIKNDHFRNFEIKYLAKDGTKIPVLFSGSVLYDTSRNIQGFVYVALNITERKLAEAQLKESRGELRNLLAYLQSVREHERTAFAREIHDELGQSLTALKMDLHWLGNKYKENPPMVSKTQSMLKLIDRTIQTVKKICIELRPGVLDDLGLTAAIEWQAQEFQNWSGITCDLFFNPEEIILDTNRSTAIFRIFQETLTNVARHAEASRISITLEQKNTHLIMEVRDNGKGIREEEMFNSKSFGLIGMRERALYLGGEFQISSCGDGGGGSTVIVSIPLEREDSIKPHIS
jgi:PAS domain S-box-containing protein